MYAAYTSRFLILCAMRPILPFFVKGKNKGIGKGINKGKKQGFQTVKSIIAQKSILSRKKIEGAAELSPIGANLAAQKFFCPFLGKWLDSP